MTTGYLYPKSTKLYPHGFLFQKNCFYSKSILLPSRSTSSSFFNTIFFYAKSLKSREKLTKPEFIIIYRFISTDYKAKTNTTSPLLFTNPAAFKITDQRLKTWLSRTSIGNMPDWDLPSRNALFKGVLFKNGRKKDKKEQVKWREGFDLDRTHNTKTKNGNYLLGRNIIRWGEKRRIDCQNKLVTDETHFKLDKKDDLKTCITYALDSLKTFLNNNLLARDLSLLLLSHDPLAKDIFEESMWGKANVIDRYLSLCIPNCFPHDRKETIPWGGEFLVICKRRYKPPIYPSFNLDKKVQARILKIPKQKIKGQLFPKSTTLRPALYKTPALFEEQRLVAL